tara:strand:- start:68 stop:241 length:174 start_codon:yes stop_codon:yes gene_type:complete
MDDDKNKLTFEKKALDNISNWLFVRLYGRLKSMGLVLFGIWIFLEGVCLTIVVYYIL